MIQIRSNAFEANSASTRCMVVSLVIGLESDFDKWENGELYYCASDRDGSSGFITKEEAIEILDDGTYKGEPTERAIKYLKTHDASEIINEGEDEYDALSEINEELSNSSIFGYDYYINDYCRYLETEDMTYTTPGGETIKVLCHYGYDC